MSGPNERKPPFPFSATTRVWFSDTDAQGIVYYGRYMPYFDHARTEYHRHLGRVGELEGRDFVMRASNVEYHAPARFDDLIETFVRIARIGRTSVTYECAAYRLDDDELLAPLRAKYFISGEINTKLGSMAALDEKIERLAREYAHGNVYRIDGVSVEFDDWHFNVRPSNTEPLLRLNLEALSAELMEEKRDEVLGVIRA